MKRLLLLILVALLVSCGSGKGAENAETPLAELRRIGPTTSSAELVGEWLLLEMIAPGGDAKTAVKARKHLDELGKGGMLAALGRGLDDSMHGRLSSAPDHYLEAVRAARSSSDPRAQYVAWFAANRAVTLRNHAVDLWPRWRDFVEAVLHDPKGIGWRARAELVEWWADEAYADAQKGIEALTSKEYGCVSHLRLAGPFGTGSAPDAYRAFPAERPGPWPARWEKQPDASDTPHLLKVKQSGCFVRADEPLPAGIYYAETFIDLESPAELLFAAQGALALFIDDEKVLDRDPREFGVWPKFGVQAWLTAGRHRILARLSDPQTSVRVMLPDGRPAEVKHDTADGEPYSVVPPRVTGEPNVISRYVTKGKVSDPRDDVSRFLCAELSWIEGQGDLAAIFTEPLVKQTKRATGPVLASSALFAERDPIFDQTSVRDLSRELHGRAVDHDPELWQSQLALALWEGERAGATEAVKRVKQLVDRFPEASPVMLALARLYGELGWSAEYSDTAKELARRFPNDEEALSTALSVHETQGNVKEADVIVARIKKLDPDSEIELTRALARSDFDAALRELKRLGARHPERKDLADRIYDVMVHAGNRQETWKKLESAINQNPLDGRARLAFADAKLASGDKNALRHALVEALVKGADPGPIEEALDLVEGTTELEHYRLDARKVIADYEKSGVSLPGTAARVLDYAATWVHHDGSSRMLEHEVVRIQSPEAIGTLSEQARLEGLVLHMRVLKQDGRELEPEDVPGKPTLTFPHLEVGDYIETEHIVSKAGDGRGEQYVGPHWFFREENIAYARSEFVVITPEGKDLVVETHGGAPAPELETKDGIVIRRWRVDKSPAAPVEPGSPPITEFLPSVRVGWGVDLEERLRSLSDNLAEVVPVDPRVARIAEKIVDPLPPKKRLARAKRLYRWVLANVEEGQEADGRRVVVGKRGNRWRGFITLCRAVGIQADYAVARNQLLPEPTGPIAAATQFTEPLIRVKTERGDSWLTLGSKYAPFGYVPVEVRGVPAYVLGGEAPMKTTTPAAGADDSVVYEGTVVLAADGSAKLDLVQRFTGKYAMAVRSAFSQLPEAQLRDVIESKLLGRALRGARLKKHELEHLDDLDEPLLLHMQAEMNGFAQNSGSMLAISPPFSPRVTQLATLPERQTPLLIGDATYQQVKLRIELPTGATLAGVVATSTITDANRKVTIADRIDGQALILDRTLDIPAGRVQPGEYPKFLDFARRADSALGRDLRVKLAR
jgi:tetratricopeptide (TPR) repeat protein